MIDLKSYFHEKYQGGESFVENVIIPIFGEDKYEDAYGVDILVDNQDRTAMAHSIGITEVLHLGTIKLHMNPTDVFDITVSDHVQMKRNRVGVQRLIRDIIATYSSAFMLFHYDDDDKWDWRFSFCSKLGSNNDVTDSKRYTFLLGPNQSCRTAADNFKKLAQKKGKIELDDVMEAFSVEALSDQFFKEYKKQYEDIVEYITGKRMVKVANKWKESVTGEPCAEIMQQFASFPDAEKAVRDYVKKLMGRLVFIQFLQKKGWMGCPAGEAWDNGDREFVQHLFANTTHKDTFVDDVLEPLFNDINTKREGDLTASANVGNGVKIPYLNGGLFEKDEYDKTVFPLPSKYIKSMLDFFASYNFTIDENDPDDAEIGVDPEMLGRIFENLLEDNKDKGAFYTPKEIVQYMCRESLIAYLQTDVKGESVKDAIRQFVTTYEASVLPADMVDDVDQKLKDVKICDPAIGSGAFPMGLLRELYACRKAIEGIDDENAVSIKTHIIQNNIYGVDYEKGAVDIARLRFWLALIVDEKNPHALPNMDFKIMQGNSLLEQYEGIDLSGMSLEVQPVKKTRSKNNQDWQQTLAFDENVALDNIQHAIQEYYQTDKYSDKVIYREMINRNIRSYILNLKGITPEIESKINNLPIPNDQFFLWHIYFKDVFDNGGFDIVIGNPPYVTLTKNNTDNKLLKVYIEDFVSIKKCYSKNIYTLFIEFGICTLLSHKGIISYIIPEGLFKTRSYEDCVSVMNKNGELLSYSTFNSYVFENAVTGSLIFNYRKEKSGVVPVHYDFDEHYNLSIVPEGDSALIDKIAVDTKELKSVAALFKGMVVKDRQKVVFDSRDNNPDIFLLGKSISKWAIKTPFYTDYNSLTIIGGTKKKTKHDVSPRILIRRTGDTLCCCMLEQPALTESTLYSCWSTDETIDNKYLIGVLNSTLMEFYNKKKNITNQQGYPQILMTDLQGLPIKIASQSDQLCIVNLVDSILSMKESSPNADTSASEKEIDRVVYKIYGLDDNEIAIIENSTR